MCSLRHLVITLMLLPAGGGVAYAQTAVGMGVVDLEAQAQPEPQAPAEPHALRDFAERMVAHRDAAEAAATDQANQADEADEPVASVAVPESEARALGPAARSSEFVDRDGVRPGEGGWVLNTLASLGMVIGLILLLRWAWARFGGGVVSRGCPAVEVLARTGVAPRNHILLVRVGGRILVLGDSNTGLRTLADLDDPDEVANLLEAVTAARSDSATRGFLQVLTQSDERYDKLRLREEGGDDGEIRIDRARESVAGLLARLKTMAGRQT